MSCISEVLKLKGDKEYLMINPHVAAEDGGIYKDYEYLVIFNDKGVRCGYVAINKEHKFYELSHYDDLPDLNVHGGVTFFDTSDYILDENLIKNSCGDKWIGFDAGHYCDGHELDLVKNIFNLEYPQEINFLRSSGEIRSKKYMVRQCKKLIDQLVELNNAN